MSEFVEVPTDCWLTTPDLIDLHNALWPGGIGIDPFHDPKSMIGAHTTLDIRRGQDAYALDWWEIADLAALGVVGASRRRALVNGPYSGDHPARTAERIATMLDSGAGAEVTNLCPAAPGSAYWSRWVWPRYAAIAWLGRWAFVAGRDLHNEKTGRIVAREGERVSGNRTEIALVYSHSLEEREGARQVEAFRELFRQWHVTVR